MKKFGITIIAIFAVIIGGLAIISLIAPDNSISENENRALRTSVNVSGKFIVDGSTQDDIEDYLKDQVAFRDFWMMLRTDILKLFGKSEINGVYRGKDDYLIEKIVDEEISEKSVEKNVECVNDFLEFYSTSKDVKSLSVMIIPTSGYMLKDKLPANAMMFDQKKYLDGFKESFSKYNYVDVSDEAVDGVGVGENYYKTDHHWTSVGAMNAASLYLDSIGMERVADQGEFKPVTEDFRGTLYSKIMDRGAAYDTIDRFYFNNEPDLSVQINGEDADGIFFDEKLEIKDQYRYFFGDNYGQVDIDAAGNHSGRKLLIIKDSFANSFTPLLTTSFDKITMVDMRFFEGELNELCTKGGYTDVLVLYNISNFVTDKNLVFLKNLEGEFTSTYGNGDEDGVIDIVGDIGGDEGAVTPSTEDYNTNEPVPNENGGYSSGEIDWSSDIIIIGNRGYETYGYYEPTAEKYANIVSGLADKLAGQANVYSLLIPLSDEIAVTPEHRERLSMGNQKNDIVKVFDMMSGNVKKVNIYDTMAKYAPEYIYFKTDHHWTQRGAYYAYREYCKSRGVACPSLDEYETNRFDGYLGSFYTSTQSGKLADNPDYVEVFYPKSTNMIDITEQSGNHLNWYVVNDVSNYRASQKYSCFIGGDNPFSVIHNPEKTDGSACILVKESFGNAFAPFLVDDYEYVYIVDYRYYEGQSLYDMAIEKGVKDILFCNNLSALSDSYKLALMKTITGA